MASSVLYNNSTPIPALAERGRQAAEKAIALAPNRPEGYLALGNRWVTTFLTEMAGLNWLPPDHLPRATQHVPQMMALSVAPVERMGRWMSVPVNP